MPLFVRDKHHVELTAAGKVYLNEARAMLVRAEAIHMAGIGENSPEMRAGVADRLAWMGVKIDPAKNEIRSDEPRVISTPDSSITVMVVPTNEEYMIALDVVDLLG